MISMEVFCFCRGSNRDMLRYSLTLGIDIVDIPLAAGGVIVFLLEQRITRCTHADIAYAQITGHFQNTVLIRTVDERDTSAALTDLSRLVKGGVIYCAAGTGSDIT